MTLSDVCHVHPVGGGVCGRPAGWRVLADRARLGRPGPRLPLRVLLQVWAGAYRGGRPPTALY